MAIAGMVLYMEHLEVLCQVYCCLFLYLFYVTLDMLFLSIIKIVLCLFCLLCIGKQTIIT